MPGPPWASVPGLLWPRNYSGVSHTVLSSLASKAQVATEGGAQPGADDQSGKLSCRQRQYSYYHVCLLCDWNQRCLKKLFKKGKKVEFVQS